MLYLQYIIINMTNKSRTSVWGWANNYVDCKCQCFGRDLEFQHTVLFWPECIQCLGLSGTTVHPWNHTASLACIPGLQDSASCDVVLTCDLCLAFLSAGNGCVLAYFGECPCQTGQADLRRRAWGWASHTRPQRWPLAYTQHHYWFTNSKSLNYTIS